MTVGQVFQVSSLSIFGDKGFQGAEVKGSIRAGEDTYRLQTCFETVEAHSALLCFRFSIVAFKDRGAVGAGVITQPASDTLFGVYQYGTILFLFIDSFIRATVNTGWFFAVVARNPLEMDADVRETALLILIDSQIFEWSGWEVMPVLTSDAAGAAA
jgi:hypothetical protein